MLAGGVFADDLYKVNLRSQTDADLLIQAKVTPVYRIADGYLILADRDQMESLTSSGIAPEFLASDISVDHLAADYRPDRANVGRFDMVYEEGALRIFRVGRFDKAQTADGAPLIPIDNSRLKITYQAPLAFNEDFSLGPISLDSLIDRVSQDSVTDYLETLQAFNGRLTGTANNYAARDWIENEFLSFGLDSVRLDSFSGVQIGDGYVPAYNVVAYKTGTRYPDRQIVVGGHFDAVPGSPGADDNGSGTVGTIELARVLAGVETEMTFIFIAFDSEESGLVGSHHYAQAAAARGDTIVYMLNMDMIGDISNDAMANLYIGSGDEPYALLWSKLADSLVGITGVLRGTSGGSDHASFAQAGYDVTFVQERTFSSHYHQPSDSTTYINFDYMTRMIKASLATAYSVNLFPPTVLISSVQDVGDGQSLQINWAPGDPTRITHYWLYWTTVPATQPDSMQVPVDSSSYQVDGLIEGQEYSFYLVAVDTDGRTSLAFQRAYGTPYSKPALPENLAGYPIPGNVDLTWAHNNTELDFDHYRVIRDDQMLPDIIYDTTFIDDDPTLGTDLHTYLAVAFDTDGNMSDTAGATAVTTKAAQLVANKILALNRSADNNAAIVNEVVTGEFMREALTGWNYDYFSDTSSTNPSRASLLNMVDYGLVIIGDESGHGQDDIGMDPAFGGILEDLAYYLSIGGKVIIFGRWGNLTINTPLVDTTFFTPGTNTFVYTDYFNIALRVLPYSVVISYPDSLVMYSDLVGAQSLQPGYPDLVWDQAATMDHTGSPYTNITGIPCPSIPVLAGSGNTVLYTYDSSNDSTLTEGRPVAWSHLSGAYKYIYFEVPLSFMQRPAAVAALQQAVTSMGIISDADDDNSTALPKKFTLSQNHPNPFNPRTVIEFYNPKSVRTKVTLEVFNILGQRVKRLFDGPAAPGMTRVEWDGHDDNGRTVATGIYFYRLRADESTLTRKMALIK